MTRQTSEDKEAEAQPDNLNTFGDRLALAINRAGGATIVAKQIGVSSSVLRKWKAGRSDPSRSKLVGIARVSKVPLEWLATGEGSPDGLSVGYRQEASPRDLELVEAVSRAAFEELDSRSIRLSPAAKARLIKFLFKHFSAHWDEPFDETVKSLVDLLAAQDSGE